VSSRVSPLLPIDERGATRGAERWESTSAPACSIRGPWARRPSAATGGWRSRWRAAGPGGSG